MTNEIKKIQIYFCSELDSSVEYTEYEIEDMLITSNLQSKIS